MQLFSVGLIERNLDFSPVLNAGNPVPTYDQTVITHTAKVFTGFTYSDAPINPPNFYGGAITAAGSYNPMACWGSELFPLNSNNMRHDVTGDDGTTNTPKTVLGGLTIAPNQSCAQDTSVTSSTSSPVMAMSRLSFRASSSSGSSPAIRRRPTSSASPACSRITAPRSTNAAISAR